MSDKDDVINFEDDHIRIIAKINGQYKSECKLCPFETVMYPDLLLAAAEWFAHFMLSHYASSLRCEALTDWTSTHATECGVPPVAEIVIQCACKIHKADARHCAEHTAIAIGMAPGDKHAPICTFCLRDLNHKCPVTIISLRKLATLLPGASPAQHSPDQSREGS